ncbi:hypothetical protein EYR41_010950 [Orbilia oligospora]|uniref:Uncharacterized protein n=1 Tax=Orbilia oligospora TaxID=2813651 RepID=A0A7C8KA38_ORBOL|nr:hypothetical protein TWF751_008781 [Orbilia oligospora]TGJ63000.1 hypothetical protein EYR41_010950 [Orbilia oligospora]
MQWQRCRPPEPLEGTATVEFYLPRETDLEYRRADDDRWKKRISFGPGALHVLHVLEFGASNLNLDNIIFPSDYKRRGHITSIIIYRLSGIFRI